MTQKILAWATRKIKISLTKKEKVVGRICFGRKNKSSLLDILSLRQILEWWFYIGSWIRLCNSGLRGTNLGLSMFNYQGFKQ